MNVAITEFLEQPSGWLNRGSSGGIVVSSRIRLARNVQGLAFPGWGGGAECSRVWDQLHAFIPEIDVMKPSVEMPMEELSDLDKQILFERHLVSRELVDKEQGSGVIVRKDETISVMVNEEDHLRLQAIRLGLDLDQAWRDINELDNRLEKEVRYAFSPSLGYLTACPSNVGTGMRASVMLHVPGLMLMKEIGPIVKGLGKIGLAVRGLGGEGTEAIGNMFQVSNQITLGEKEEDVFRNLEQIVLEMVEHEQNARKRLTQDKPEELQDHVGRAYGILTHAHVLTSKECLDLLSGLRLGLELGILSGIPSKLLDELLLLTQPAHLQKIQGRMLKPKERDRARAALVRERLLKAQDEARPREEKNE